MSKVSAYIRYSRLEMDENQAIELKGKFRKKINTT